jgi:hypothetical protein
MEFIFRDNNIILSSDKKEILLTPETVILDGLDIALPGEYEKSGCLMYAWHKNDEKLYHFRTEGYWIAYIPALISDISPEALDFLGSVDVLVMPGAKSMQNVLEKVEPRMIVTYGESAHEIATPLGAIEVVTKYKLKEADLSSEKTGCVVLG